MKRRFAAQIGMLAGIFGFFSGGLLTYNKELIVMFASAVIGWTVFFFPAFFVTLIVTGDDERKIKTTPAQEKANTAAGNKQKGKKVDFLVNDDLYDDIFKK